MTFALRRAAREDYNVLQDGEIVERIYRMKADRELWRWMTPGLRAPSHGPSGGVADSPDEAKAAFRAAWDAHGLALFTIWQARRPTAWRGSRNSTCPHQRALY